MRTLQNLEIELVVGGLMTFEQFAASSPGVPSAYMQQAYSSYRSNLADASNKNADFDVTYGGPYNGNGWGVTFIEGHYYN